MEIAKTAIGKLRSVNDPLFQPHAHQAERVDFDAFVALIIARTRSFCCRANSSHAWRVNSAVNGIPQSSSMRHIGPSWIRDFTIPGSRFLALADTVSMLFSKRTSSALI